MIYAHTDFNLKRHKSKKGKILGIISVTTAILLICIGINHFLNKVEKPIKTEVLSVIIDATPTPNSSALEKIVQNELIGTTGSYGIVILNLKTGERYMTNERKTYKAGSLYKLWIMATVFEQIKNGKLSEDTVLKETVAQLYKKFNLASDSAGMTFNLESGEGQTGENTQEPKEAEEPTITYSVNMALEKMITISDNFAALLLTSKVRLSNVISFLKKEKMSGSKVGTGGEDPITTASDIATFLVKIHERKLIDPQYSEKMLALLKQQRLNGKLPKYLPEEIVIAHKTGELYDFTHDAGIVHAPNGDYVIVVLTKSSSPPQAVERIANISKAVYNYFSVE